MEKEKPKDHKFWNTQVIGLPFLSACCDELSYSTLPSLLYLYLSQPVLHDDAVHEENEAIDNTSTIDSVRKVLLSA